MEGAICEPNKINFFFGSDKLLMTEIKSEQAYKHVGDTRWHYQNWSIRDISWFFFVGENIDDLKFSTFF